MQLIAAACCTLFQLAEQFFRNGAQAVIRQRTEHDHFIQTACQFWAEPLFRFLNGLRRLLFKHGFTARCKAQRSTLARQKARAKVGREQHDGIAEIRFTPHGIGELPILQDLQQDVLDIRVGFFDLIKQDHAVGAAAHSLGKLPALIMAQIARRGTQQPGSGVLLLIFRHIKLEQGLFAAEPADGQRPGKSCFANAGGAKEQHGSYGPSRLPKAGTAAADGPCHSSDRAALPDDLLVQALLQLFQPFPFLLSNALCGHAAGLCHHMGDIIRGQHGLGLLFPFRTDACRCAGFIHKVDGLIRQKTPRQIPHREFNCRLQGLLRKLYVVIAFVARGQTAEDIDGLCRRGLLHLHLAETAFQGSILLDMGAEFLGGRGTDHLQFSARQYRL